MALFARVGLNVSLFSNNCCSKLIFNGTKLKIFEKCSPTRVSFRRSISNYAAIVDGNYVPFKELLSRRQEEARRSILVEIRKISLCHELYFYCSQFGNVRGMYHYQLQSPPKNFVLVEFTNSTSVGLILSKVMQKSEGESIILPVYSTMLQFRMENISKNATLKRVPLKETYGCKLYNDHELFNFMEKANSVSEQMAILHQVSRLSETEIRLRFQTANQLERAFSGIFPNFHVFPFGSSVNGFGKQGCDLDLVVDLDSEIYEASANGQFMYHTKLIKSDERRKTELRINALANMMEHFIPGIYSVRRILKARVPIIKYHHLFTNIECDLNVTDITGVQMAELLYVYGEIDLRVKPLVFAVRKWAQNIGLTNNSPGRWIKNFSLTLMVIFYLQQKEILPSMNLLRTHVKKTCLENDNDVNDIFLHNISKLPKQKYSELSLQSLLSGFFEYYSLFDYANKAISLNEGVAISKPTCAPFYTCNPLNSMLNVTQNVSIDELLRLQVALGNAAEQLELNQTIRKCWGLPSIFNFERREKSTMLHKGKVDVTSIFNVEEDTKILFDEEDVKDSVIVPTSVTSDSTDISKNKDQIRRR